MSGAPVTAPVDVVGTLSHTLALHHALHLLPGVLACLAPHLQAQPTANEGPRTVGVGAVVGLASLLTQSGRPELITRVLLVVAPWLPAGGRAVSVALPVAPRKVGTTGLTGRQAEMLDLVSQGLTNGQIGRKLGLSEDTVKTYLARAYRALDVRDRAHAVRRCFEAGIFTVSD